MVFFFSGPGGHRDLHSFPTRRSSDLTWPGPGAGTDSRTTPWTPGRCGPASTRSEEHTSELQSRRDLVCRLLLEKKKERFETERCTCEMFSLAAVARWPCLAGQDTLAL